MPMQKTERRLLGLRRRVTAPSLLGRASESQEDKSSGSYSSSPRSADNSRCRGSPRETASIFPFSPVDTALEGKDDDEGELARRPSEHFLEVLEEQKGQTLPKIEARPRRPCSGNPHRRPAEFEQEWKLGPRRNAEGSTDVQLLNALNGSNIASYKHPKTQGTDCVSPGGLQECALDESPSRKIFSRVSSLPVIVPPRCRETSGELISIAAMPPKDSLSPHAPAGTGTLTALKYIQSAQQCSPSNSGGDDHGVENEKFGMICEWLKECEAARTS